MVELNKVVYHDKLKIKDMVEGKPYTITQGDNGYSDGVMVTKNGDELRLRHFWTDWVEKEDKEGYYFKEGGLFYPSDVKADQIMVAHKDIMQIVPDAITYTFEDMTLGDFYGIVEMGLYYLEDEADFAVPNHLKGKHVTYDRNGNKLHELG